MEFWETTPYLKWYKSHKKFSILAHLFIEDFEDTPTEKKNETKHTYELYIL